jgi:hypothetical protein
LNEFPVQDHFHLLADLPSPYCWLVGSLPWATEAKHSASRDALRVKRLKPLHIAILIAVLAVAVRLAVGPVICDDAYITFRYARNLATGEGFVYNAGERVLGTSTPLFTMLMALLGKVCRDAYPVLSVIVNALCDGATCFVLFAIGRCLGLTWAGLSAALLYAILPDSAAWAVSGMETSFYVLLLMLAAYTLLKDKEDGADKAADRVQTRVATAILAGILLMTRPDSLVMVVVLLGVFVWCMRRPPVREMLIAAAVALPWTLFATFYYGSPVPNSVAAKGAIIGHPGALQASGEFAFFLANMFVPCSNRITRALVPGLIPAIQVTVLIVTATLFVVGVRHIILKNRAASVILVFPVVYTAVFCLVNPLMFPWYMVPVAPFVVLGVAAGLFAAAAKFAPRRNAAVFASAVVLLTLLTGFLSYRKLTTLSDVKEQRLRELAELVREDSGGEGVIAAPEVGAVGYFSDMRMIDAAGLVSAEALPFLTENLLPIPTELMLEYRPDYLISTDLFLEVGPEGKRFIDTGLFREQYVLLAEIPGELPQFEVKSFRAYRRIKLEPAVPGQAR